MDLNEPVDEDGSHFVVNLRLADHVVGTGVHHFLILEEELEYFLSVLSAMLWIRGCVLLAVLRIFTKYRTLTEVLIAAVCQLLDRRESDVLSRLSLLVADSGVCSAVAAHVVEASFFDS